jgi:glycosyltransferase involved in cell wall biosynthesis
MSSLWEGHPLSVLEAMAAGLPVVAPDVTGIAETVVDGVTGLVTPAPEPDSLAKAIVAE